MLYNVEIVLRERDYAVTEEVHHLGNPPSDWTEIDVEGVLTSMLQAIDRVKNPGDERAQVRLRGFSWIVEPTDGGVVIAMEIPSGAAVAGPFDIPQPRLDGLITRVLDAARETKTVVALNSNTLHQGSCAGNYSPVSSGSCLRPRRPKRETPLRICWRVSA